MRTGFLTLSLVLATVPALAQAQAAPQADDTLALLDRGQYLAQAGDCIACHTAPGGVAFAGGLPMKTPAGTIYSTNITPDAKTGIGTYSYDEFVHAVRGGVAKDGHRLYPAMPYPSYAKVTDADMRAIYAYFMERVQPVEQPNRKSDIPWPLSIRWPMGLWTSMFVTDVRFQPDTNHDDQWNRGAYLIESLGHCGSCHTPRGLAYQEKSMGWSDGPLFLSGSTIDGWHAKSLRGELGNGLGDWSEADIAQFLKTGRNSRTAAFGGMAEVISHSSQHMDDRDLAAIAAYLKSLTPKGGNAYAARQNDTTRQDLRDGRVAKPGTSEYAEFCISCHRADGDGFPKVFPALAANSTVVTDDTTSLIRLVLEGGKMPATTHEPLPFAMPGFAALTDRETAQVISFIRSSWGNHAAQVNPDQVAKVRQSLKLPANP